MEYYVLGDYLLRYFSNEITFENNLIFNSKSKPKFLGTMSGGVIFQGIFLKKLPLNITLFSVVKLNQNFGTMLGKGCLLLLKQLSVEKSILIHF